MNYDYVCVGGGPAGLTIVYYLAKMGYSCLLIDQNASLGGCHRVNRVNGLFTEHGPRIYSTAYTNFINLLSDMRLDFHELFTPYKFSIANIGGKGIRNFSLREMGLLAVSFMKLMFDPTYGTTLSMEKYMNQHEFNDESRDYVDRLCRLTDGAGADRYTLFQFLQLINQQALYTIYQPQQPNDRNLFQLWEQRLLSTGRVKILSNTYVQQLITYNNRIRAIRVRSPQFPTGIEINGKNFILAIPPEPLVKLLSQSPETINAFGSMDQLDRWSQQNQYIQDIPIIFHWDHQFKLNDIHGFPTSDWNIAFINLSDYMDFHDPRSKIVMTVCITTTDVVSKVTGKTANQSNEQELINEVFRQLREPFPNLPKPTVVLLSPTVRKIKGRWIDMDTAYVRTNNNQILEPQSPVFSNLYSLGTHNGTSFYNFTSLESAVSSALSLTHKLVPESTHLYPFQKMWTMRDLLCYLTLLVIVGIIIYYLTSYTQVFQPLLTQWQQSSLRQSLRKLIPSG